MIRCILLILILGLGTNLSADAFDCKKKLGSFLTSRKKFSRKAVVRKKIYEKFRKQGLYSLEGNDLEWMKKEINYIVENYKLEANYIPLFEKRMKASSDEILDKEYKFLLNRIKRTPFNDYNSLFLGIKRIMGTENNLTNIPPPEVLNWLVEFIEDQVMRKSANFKFPETVVKIRGNYPINSRYAGSFYPQELLSDSIKKKYRNIPVYIDDEGFPMFGFFSISTVKIRMMGNNSHDFAYANRVAGFGAENPTPDKHTWHHHHDTEHMLLLPHDIHSAIKHNGGVSKKIEEFENGYLEENK